MSPSKRGKAKQRGSEESPSGPPSGSSAARTSASGVVAANVSGATNGSDGSRGAIGELSANSSGAAAHTREAAQAAPSQQPAERVEGEEKEEPLVVKNTFITVVEQRGKSRRRRARSAPANGDKNADSEYMASLALQLRRVWKARESGKKDWVFTHKAAPEDANSAPGGLAEDMYRASRLAGAGMSFGSTNRAPSMSSTQSVSNLSAGGCSKEGKSSSSATVFDRNPRTAQNDQPDLQVVRRMMYQHHTSRTSDQRVSLALERIADIPEQVADVLRLSAGSIADDLDGELAAIQQLMERNENMSEATLTQMASILEAIPDLVFKSFGGSFARARDMAKKRVEIVIANVAKSDVDKDARYVLQQLEAIPEEMQHITEMATDEAMHDSKDQVHKIIDKALAGLEEPILDPDEREAMIEKIVKTVPTIYPRAINNARNLAAATVKQVVKAVRYHEDPDLLPNRAIADALLRFKVDDSKLENNWPLKATEKQQDNDHRPLSHQYPGRILSSMSSSEIPSVLDEDSSNQQQRGKAAEVSKRQMFRPGNARGSRPAKEVSSDCPLFYAKARAADDSHDSFPSFNSVRSDPDSAPPELGHPSRKNSGDAASSSQLPAPSGRLSKDEEVESGSRAVSEMRLAKALAAIDVIPDQLVKVLHQRATELAESVEQELKMLRENARFNKKADRAAMQRFEELPGIILANFESRFDRVKIVARERVDKMISCLQNGHLASDHVIKQLWTIPEEVQRLADAAVSDAMQESHEHATKQLSSMEAFAEVDLNNVKQKVIGVLDCTAFAADLRNVKTAIAAAQPAEPEDAVAASSSAALLGDSTNLLNVELSPPTNPGSMGHPDLCPRPCLYFPVGQCSNGDDCDFCHLPHPRRPSHLNKRHREALKNMPYAKAMAILHPILRQKLKNAVPTPAVLSCLDELLRVAGREAMEAGAPPAKPSREDRPLQNALRNISLRALLTMMRRIELDPSSDEGRSMTTFLETVVIDSNVKLLAKSWEQGDYNED
eukprot:TRINITY_DN5289_c1_g1_i1.p1 TRINITY_DN5289_c1_g1~~TRINITY_DN5289_c1_g1_i1.p1  ORF type:complete len:1009 (-),score=220.77 TRINITY_DN5289_c1_g1_i1:125-3151(-)